MTTRTGHDGTPVQVATMRLLTCKHLPEHRAVRCLQSTICSVTKPSRIESPGLVGEERETDPENENWDFRIVDSVTPVSEQGYTKVSWKESLGSKSPLVNPAKKPKIYTFRIVSGLFGHNAPDWQRAALEFKKQYLGLNDFPIAESTTPKRPTTADGTALGITEWPEFEINVGRRRIDMDGE